MSALRRSLAALGTSGVLLVSACGLMGGSEEPAAPAPVVEEYTQLCVDPETQVRVEDWRCEEAREDPSTANMWVWWYVLGTMSQPAYGYPLQGTYQRRLPEGAVLSDLRPPSTGGTMRDPGPRATAKPKGAGSATSVPTATAKPGPAAPSRAPKATTAPQPAPKATTAPKGPAPATKAPAPPPPPPRQAPPPPPPPRAAPPPPPRPAPPPPPRPAPPPPPRR